MISFKHTGSFNNTDKFFRNAVNSNYMSILEKYGREGVLALSSNTPIDSGKTANSWDYKIIRSKNGAKISWFNTNVVDNVPIAVIIQYGHATRNGGFVQGRDYINPAMRPIFDRIANELWGEVAR